MDAAECCTDSCSLVFNFISFSILSFSQSAVTQVHRVLIAFLTKLFSRSLTNFLHAITLKVL